MNKAILYTLIFIYSYIYYLYICAYAEFHSILIPVTFSAEINSSQPNYFSIPPVTFGQKHL